MNYHIALSFAGEDREFVDQVAQHLSNQGVSTFYDNFEGVNLWGKDLYQELSSIYRDRAHFTVIFISKHYARKLWTKHELKSAQARAFEENREYILPARFDDTELPGVLGTIGYLDLRALTPAVFAERIIDKLKQAGVVLIHAVAPPNPINPGRLTEQVGSTWGTHSKKTIAHAVSTFLENGNVFVEVADGTVRQLTFVELDEAPFLLNNGKRVLFVRRDETFGAHARKVFRKRVMIVGVDDLKERTVVERKPERDGLENTLDIMRIDKPYLSPDDQYLFFTTEGGAVSSAFVKVEVLTGKWISIGSVEEFEPLLDGPYVGHFLVSYSEVKASGRQLYYKVIDPDGNQVKEFADQASAQKFFDKVHSGTPRQIFKHVGLEFSENGIELQAMDVTFSSKRDRVVLESRTPIHMRIDRIELQLNEEQWARRLASAGLLFTCQYFDAQGNEIGTERRPMSFSLFFDPTYRYPIFEVKGRWSFVSQHNPYYPKDAHHHWCMTIEVKGFELGNDETMDLKLHSSTNHVA